MANEFSDTNADARSVRVANLVKLLCGKTTYLHSYRRVRIMKHSAWASNSQSGDLDREEIEQWGGCIFRVKQTCRLQLSLREESIKA